MNFDDEDMKKYYMELLIVLLEVLWKKINCGGDA